MAETVRIETDLRWEVSPAGGRWMAVCQTLDFALEAFSRDEVPGLIDEALQLLMADLMQDSELEGFVREHGWTAVNLSAAGPAGDVGFDVVWKLASDGGDGIRQQAGC